MESFNLQKQIKQGAWIYSSGSTGVPKKIFRTPENIKLCNETALRTQRISSNSSIYTVTRMTHAGGLLAQTLPALSVGAHVCIEAFNPYRFLRQFRNHTHTFLPPEHMLAVSKSKSFRNFDFEGRFILTGSSPVSYDVIEKFVQRNAIVQPNWGMSEVGPICIYSSIDSIEKLNFFREITPENGSLMGDRFEVEWKIQNQQLWIKSPMCIHDSWFATGDRVRVVDQNMFFCGRLDQ